MIPQDRVDVYFCGGSQIGNRGVPPTQAFPVLVSRRLRAAWGQSFGTARSILLPEKPEILRERLEKKRTPGRGFVLVLIPRNVHFGIIPWTVRGWLARLRRQQAMPGGVEPVADMLNEDPPSPAIKGGNLLNGAAAAVFAPAVPVRARAYWRDLAECVEVARGLGARLIVLATPIPLGRRRFPGTWSYQAYYARGIRRLAAPDVRIADTFRRLSQAQREHVHLGDDAFHLTSDGHRIVAEELLQVLTPWGERSLPAAPQSEPLATEDEEAALPSQ